MTTLESGQRAYINKPNARFMRAHWTHVVAQGFGSGLSPVVPGTIGTLLAWVSFVLLSTRWPAVFTPLAWAGIIAAGAALGVWVCEKTGRDLGIPDHGSMVWDEIIAFWLVLLFVMPAGVWTQLLAFLCFRFFDMVKPPPIGYLDRRFKGGFGAMLDDLGAAFLTLLAFAIWRSL
jgi:phosphatidylglycerophosphatase A